MIENADSALGDLEDLSQVAKYKMSDVIACIMPYFMFSVVFFQRLTSPLNKRNRISLATDIHRRDVPTWQWMDV